MPYNATNDLFALLDLDETASTREIKDAYRKRAFELHPDRNHDDDATERFQEVNAAAEILVDEDKRAAYLAKKDDSDANDSDSNSDSDNERTPRDEGTRGRWKQNPKWRAMKNGDKRAFRKGGIKAIDPSILNQGLPTNTSGVKPKRTNSAWIVPNRHVFVPSDEPKWQARSTASRALRLSGEAAQQQSLPDAPRDIVSRLEPKIAEPEAPEPEPLDVVLEQQCVRDAFGNTFYEPGTEIAAPGNYGSEQQPTKEVARYRRTVEGDRKELCWEDMRDNYASRSLIGTKHFSFMADGCW